jgi:hypothetical protein
MGTRMERSARGSGKGTCAALATGTHRVRAREGVLRTVPSTPRRWATAGGAAGILTASWGEGTRTAVRRCVYAHAGALTDTSAQERSLEGARRGIARARRAHRKLNSLSSDSAAGIVPSSAFEAKDLRRAWFVPLCTEMRMHRSVPRTHTSTARGGRIGSASERVLDTGTRGGCSTRALFVPGRRKVLQPCRSAHTPSMVHVDILEGSLATHTHGPVLRGHAHGGGRGACAVLADSASRRALGEYARTTARHGTAAPIAYYTFSQRGRRVLGGDSRPYGSRVRWGAVRARAAAGASDAVLER